MGLNERKASRWRPPAEARRAGRPARPNMVEKRPAPGEKSLRRTDCHIIHSLFMTACNSLCISSATFSSASINFSATTDLVRRMGRQTASL